MRQTGIVLACDLGGSSFRAALIDRLGFAGIDLGIRNIGSGAGWLAVAISIVALVLAVANLIMDFDYIEQGIAMQAPASESWRAAFGLTVTLVWLYIEILRLFSYFMRSDD